MALRVAFLQMRLRGAYLASRIGGVLCEESLVRTAGSLFIVASTVVRFILDTISRDPGSQMDSLKIDGRISLDGLWKLLSADTPTHCPIKMQIHCSAALQGGGWYYPNYPNVASDQGTRTSDSPAVCD